jgi:hypothetical protein
VISVTQIAVRQQQKAGDPIACFVVQLPDNPHRLLIETTRPPTTPANAAASIGLFAFTEVVSSAENVTPSVDVTVLRLLIEVPNIFPTTISSSSMFLSCEICNYYVIYSILAGDADYHIKNNITLQTAISHLAYIKTIQYAKKRVVISITTLMCFYAAT